MISVWFSDGLSLHFYTITYFSSNSSLHWNLQKHCTIVMTALPTLHSTRLPRISSPKRRTITSCCCCCCCCSCFSLYLSVAKWKWSICLGHNDLHQSLKNKTRQGTYTQIHKQERSPLQLSRERLCFLYLLVSLFFFFSQPPHQQWISESWGNILLSLSF